MSPAVAGDLTVDEYVLPAQAEISNAPLSAEELDAVRLAAQFKGTLFADEVELYKHENETLALADKIEAAFPDEITYIEMNNGGLQVGFKAKVPQRFIDEFQPQAKVKLTVQSNLGYSEVELVDPAKELYFKLSEEAPELNLAADIDARRGTVEINVVQSEFASLLRGPSSTTQLERIISSSKEVQNLISKIPLDVELSFGNERGSSDLQVVRGGGVLQACTTGFTAVKSGIPNGFITARHCFEQTSYEGRKIVTLRGQMKPMEGDGAFFSTTEKTEANFYSAPGKLTSVKQVSSPRIGQSICKYGATTKTTCSTVYKVQQCANNYCELAVAKANISQRGDSGGPWFSGTTAIGVHHGTANVDGQIRSAFTPVIKIENALGVKIKKVP